MKKQPKPIKLSKAQEIWVIHELEKLNAVQIYMKYPRLGQLSHIREAIKRYSENPSLQVAAWDVAREIEVRKNININ